MDLALLRTTILARNELTAAGIVVNDVKYRIHMDLYEGNGGSIHPFTIENVDAITSGNEVAYVNNLIGPIVNRNKKGHS
jgi:hypothetical protein